jgi:hypothetical protein
MLDRADQSLSRAKDRLARSRAALERSSIRAGRDQSAVDREVHESERALQVDRTDLGPANPDT